MTVPTGNSSSKTGKWRVLIPFLPTMYVHLSNLETNQSPTALVGNLMSGPSIDIRMGVTPDPEAPYVDPYHLIPLCPII